MAWYHDRRMKVFFISTIIGLIAGTWGLYQTWKFDQQHDQYQNVVLYDMNIMVKNQKILVDNQRNAIANATEAKLRDVNTHLIYNYSELNVNPTTGQP